MTTTPEVLANIAKALAEVQTAVDDAIHDAALDPDIGEISADFALEAAIDFLDSEDFPELGQFAGEFLDLLAKMANH